MAITIYTISVSKGSCTAWAAVTCIPHLYATYAQHVQRMPMFSPIHLEQDGLLSTVVLETLYGFYTGDALTTLIIHQYPQEITD